MKCETSVKRLCAVRCAASLSARTGAVVGAAVGAKNRLCSTCLLLLQLT